MNSLAQSCRRYIAATSATEVPSCWRRKGSHANSLWATRDDSRRGRGLGVDWAY